MASNIATWFIDNVGAFIMAKANAEPELSEFVAYFEGPVGTAVINEYFDHDIVKANRERALLVLRLEYVNLFCEHYRGTHCDCLKNFYLYVDIGRHWSRLNKEIMANKVPDYMDTAKHLVHLIELMDAFVKEHQFQWNSCHRCKNAIGFPTTPDSPILKCLAMKHNLTEEYLAQKMELPSPCSCESQAHHNPGHEVPH